MQEKLEEVELGMYNQNEVELELPYKERLRLRKEKVANVDESFGEEEGRSELQRAKEGVESLNVDPKALRMYVDLALLTTKGWHEGLNHHEDSKDKFERQVNKNNALRALKRLGPQMVNIRRLAKMKIEEAEMQSMPRPQSKTPGKWEKIAMSDRAGTRVAEKLEDLIDLLRSITSAYDRVLMMSDRFNDMHLPPLDPGMVDRFRDQKRMVSGFLTRTKDDVKRVMSKNLEFNRWRNSRDKDGDEIDDHDSIDTHDSNMLTETPDSGSDRKIARQLRQIHLDTDRDLNRVRSASRRQRNERRHGIETRMERRLGKENFGVVGDDLRIERGHRGGDSDRYSGRRVVGGDRDARGGKEEESRRRMERRAAEIDIN